MDMMPILFRWLSTVVPVGIALLLSFTLEGSSAGKILTVILSATVIAVIEWLLIWSPKHFALARRLLDGRAKMIGVYVQDVKKAIYGQEGNRFSIFWVEYSGDGAYRVAGRAYDPNGVEHASWHSTGSPDFAPDNRSITYRWTGTVMEDEDSDDPDRTGIAEFNIRDDTSYVEHVGMKMKLLVEFQKVTNEWLKNKGFDECQPNDLKTNDELRDRVAREYARKLLPSTTAPSPGVADV